MFDVIINTAVVAVVSALVSAIVNNIAKYLERRMQRDAQLDDDELEQLNEEKTMSCNADAGKMAKHSPDLTKYSFGDKCHLGKGRLVLEIIKEYVARNPSVTYKQLEEVFPASLRGLRRKTTWGCFNKREDAEDLFLGTGIRRHFLNPSEIVTLSNGQELAVSSQWGIGNIGPFLAKAKELGFNIVEEE